MRKRTLEFYGIKVAVTYDVLPGNIAIWDLDPDAYQGTDPSLIKLSEALLRQVHGYEISNRLLETDFYDNLAEVQPRGLDEDVPF